MQAYEQREDVTIATHKSHLTQEEEKVVTSNRPSWLPWQQLDATITKSEGDSPKECERYKRKRKEKNII